MEMICPKSQVSGRTFVALQGGWQPGLVSLPVANRLPQAWSWDQGSAWEELTKPPVSAGLCPYSIRLSVCVVWASRLLLQTSAAREDGRC